MTPGAIEAVVRRADRLGDEFRIVINRERATDELVAQVERSEGVLAKQAASLRRALEAEFKARSLRTNVQILEPHPPDRTEFEAKRISDEHEPCGEIQERA